MGVDEPLAPVATASTEDTTAKIAAGASTDAPETITAGAVPVIHVQADSATWPPAPVPADDAEAQQEEAPSFEAPLDDSQNGPQGRLFGFRPPVAVDRTTTVKVWRRGADGRLCFPELEDPDFAVSELAGKAPLAVCISGGGFRATTLALGWLRALQHLGLLSKVRYLSVISGASWLGAALCFQPSGTVDTFLGPYLPPAECSLEALAAVGDKGKTYPRAVADAAPVLPYIGGAAVAAVGELIKQLRERLLGVLGISTKERMEVARHWTTAMAGAFLTPFGLGNVDKSTVLVPGTKVAAGVKERAVKVGRGDRIYEANVTDLPFLIIGQALLLPKTDTKYYPFEWTPLYGGCPAPYNDTSLKLGAGWVETLGLNAQLVKAGAANGSGNGAAAAANGDGSGGAEEVEVRPTGPASLGEATGISSGYISMMMTGKNSTTKELLQKALGFHSARYFDMQDWQTHDLLMTDGGAYDLYGIFPALRRQLPNIMVCNCNGRSLVTDLAAFSADKDLPGLFGAVENDPEYNRLHQVFKPEGFQKLFEALKAKKDAGEAPVHVEYYEVLGNEHLGIPGGWTTRVMWVINERMAQWEEKLPEATRQKIPAPHARLQVFEEASLKDFPYVDTMYMDYTPELVSLLSNHAAWMLVSNEQLVREMLEVKA